MVYARSGRAVKEGFVLLVGVPLLRKVLNDGGSGADIVANLKPQVLKKLAKDKFLKLFGRKSTNKSFVSLSLPF